MAKEAEKPNEDSVDLMERIRRLELSMDGFCPNCFMRVAGWERPLNKTTIDQLGTMGIDHLTGHKKNCGMK